MKKRYFFDEYYKYSFFADLSYVNWISNKNYTYIDIRAATSDPDTQKGPESIVKDFFITKGWEISNVQENDDVGFKASLYSDGTEKILAIASTENLTDWDENLSRVGGIGVAIKAGSKLV